MMTIQGQNDGTFTLHFSAQGPGGIPPEDLTVVVYGVRDIHEALDHWLHSGARQSVHQVNAGGDCPLCIDGRRKEVAP